MDTAATLLADLQTRGSAAVAAQSQRFFKTGPGEYGEGEVFIGIRVPDLRALARRCRAMPLPEVAKVLRSPLHEARLCALLILVEQYRRGDETDRAAIYALYLDSTAHINNWDLVDSSAYFIVGPHLERRDRSPLYTLARSASLWERRIAIIATLHFIRGGDFADTLALAALLLRDREDLIHKATGWMLREVGSRDLEAETRFLDQHAAELPRTMLRYAIEKLPPPLRQRYLRA